MQAPQTIEDSAQVKAPGAKDEAAKADDKADGATRRPRSGTRYPYYGLTKCLDIVAAVRRAGGAESLNSEVMREMGVSKAEDRLWAYGIPAAVQFGLIERVGQGQDGRIKLTELSRRITLPASPDEARVAKVEAFKTPELYAKLLERFAGHPVPSRDGLRNLLVREHNIVESMAQNAADAFLESLKAIEVISATGEIAMEGPAPGDVPKVNGPVPPPATVAPTQPSAATNDDNSIPVPTGFVVYKCKISDGQVIELPLPKSFKKRDAKRIFNFLLTQVDDADDDEV